MPSSGVSLASAVSIGTGVLLVYTGLKGKNLLAEVQGIVQGKSPKYAASANPISSGSSAITGTGSSGQTTTAPGTGASASAGENLAMAAVLAAIGAPPTRANLASLVNWSAQECPWNDQPPDGALYTNNFFNTTLQTSSSVGVVNSVGVQIYRTLAGGISATAQTLLDGYPAIVAALRAGTGLANAGSEVAAELSGWSDGGYDSV